MFYHVDSLNNKQHLGFSNICHAIFLPKLLIFKGKVVLKLLLEFQLFLQLQKTFYL